MIETLRSSIYMAIHPADWRPSRYYRCAPARARKAVCVYCFCDSKPLSNISDLCFYPFAFTAEIVKLESNEPRLLLPLRIMLFCFDFAGSGISEGEYISLGWCFDSILNHFAEDQIMLS